MRLKFIIILNLLFLYNIFGIEYHIYKVEVMTEIPLGKDSLSLGYFHILKGQPQGLGIDDDSNFYISDTVNNRILILNNDLRYKNEIKNQLNMAIQFEFDKRHNIIGFFNYYGIVKIDPTGNVIFRVNPSRISNYKYYSFDYFLVFEDIVFDYTIKGKIVSIINPKSDNEKNKDNFLNSEKTHNLFNRETDSDLIKGLTIDGKDRIFYNGNLVTRDYQKYFTYWSEQHKKNGEKNTVLNLSIHPSDLRYSSLKYIGKDVNDNIYWADTCAVAVFNKKGFLIEYFVPQKKENIITLPVVHPSGDIYYLASKYSKIKKSDKYSDDYYPVVGFYLYRVKNVWDPKGRARWYRESGVKDLRPISQNPGK